MITGRLELTLYRESKVYWISHRPNYALVLSSTGYFVLIWYIVIFYVYWKGVPKCNRKNHSAVLIWL